MGKGDQVLTPPKVGSTNIRIREAGALKCWFWRSHPPEVELMVSGNAQAVPARSALDLCLTIADRISRTILVLGRKLKRSKD